MSLVATMSKEYYNHVYAYSGQKNCSNVGHFGKDYIIVPE